MIALPTVACPAPGLARPAPEVSPRRDLQRTPLTAARNCSGRRDRLDGKTLHSASSSRIGSRSCLRLERCSECRQAVKWPGSTSSKGRVRRHRHFFVAKLARSRKPHPGGGASSAARAWNLGQFRCRHGVAWARTAAKPAGAEGVRKLGAREDLFDPPLLQPAKATNTSNDNTCTAFRRQRPYRGDEHDRSRTGRKYAMNRAIPTGICAWIVNSFESASWARRESTRATNRMTWLWRHDRWRFAPGILVADVLARPGGRNA